MKILPRSTQSARRLGLFFLALFAALAVSLFSEQHERANAGLPGRDGDLSGEMRSARLFQEGMEL